MVAVSSPGGLIFDFLFVVVCLFFAVVMGVIAYRRSPVSATRAVDWPETEGTIQSVNQVRVGRGRGSTTIDVGDFSYKVDDEFHSGRATISRGFSTGDGSPKELVNQKVRVRYDSQKPERFSFPEQQVGEFLLTPFVEINATDVDPIDLNIA